MLLVTTLRQNALLATLTDEQLQAVENLSRNDETTVLATAKNEIYNNLSSTVNTIAGIAQNSGEETAAYIERVLKEVKVKADSVTELNTKLETLTTEKAALEEQIKSGKGNEALTAQLKSKETELETTKALLTQANENKEKIESDYKVKIQSLQLDNEIGLAMQGLSIKDADAESTKALLKIAFESVKGMNPEFIDDGKGGVKVVYKDENGATRLNTKNAEAITTTELLQDKLKTFNLIEESRQAAGIGGKGNGKGSGGIRIDISSAKNKDQANELITKSLVEQGLLPGTVEYIDGLKQAWAENNVESLPSE